MPDVELAGRHVPMLAGGLAPVQRAVAAQEAATAHQRGFSVLIVPGLLQTPEYIRAVLTKVSHTYGGAGAPDDLEEGVAARVERQAILNEPGHTFHFVLLEQVLWSPAGSLQPWRTQLVRLAEVARGSVPSVTLGVIARGTVWAGRVPNLAHEFVMNDTTSVGLELAHEYLVVTAPEDLAFYEEAFNCVDRHAVYGEDAAELIEATALELGVA